MKKLIKWLNGHPFLKNLILAACAVIVFIFIVNISLNLFTRHGKYHAVPDFTGMTMADAERAARDGRLKLEINDMRYVPAFDPDVVLAQKPEPGTEVKSGRRIFLTINSAHQKMVRVPYVTGVSLRQAKNNLEVVGFEIERLIYQPDIATNYVLETRYENRVIESGSTFEAEQGSGITLVVGINEEESTVIVPKVVGFPYKVAKSRLWEMGLNLGNSVFDQDIPLLEHNEARVWQQSPAQGARVTLGTRVTLKLTLDAEKVENGSLTSDKEAQRLAAERRRAEEEAAAQQAAGEGEADPRTLFPTD